MNKLLVRTIFVISIGALCVPACFPAEEFTDEPSNLAARQAAFEKVVTILEQMNSADEDAAIRYTQYADKRVRRAAALRLMTLSAVSPAAVRALSKLLLHDPDARVRSAAVRALGETAEGASANAVVQGICDKNANVRLYALKALIHMDSRANEAIAGHLVPSTNADRRCPTRSTGNHTLRDELMYQLETHGEKFLPALSYSLTKADTNVVSATLELLQKLGRSAAIALPQIVELMHNADETTRLKCIDALVAIGDQHPAVMPALYEAQNDSAPRIQTAAQNAVQRIQAMNARPHPNSAGRNPRGPVNYPQAIRRR